MIHSAGSTESSDCLIRVSPSDDQRITIESIVLEQFGDAIQNVLESTLNAHGVTHVHVECFDKGALDVTIKSRLETALKRGGYLE